MPKVRWVVSYGFVANFIHFPAAQTFWKSVKIWQSYREFKGGNFFETIVDQLMWRRRVSVTDEPVSWHQAVLHVRTRRGADYQWSLGYLVYQLYQRCPCSGCRRASWCLVVGAGISMISYGRTAVYTSVDGWDTDTLFAAVTLPLEI